MGKLMHTIAAAHQLISVLAVNVFVFGASKI
jgi:hypothetical protein